MSPEAEVETGKGSKMAGQRRRRTSSREPTSSARRSESSNPSDGGRQPDAEPVDPGQVARTVALRKLAAQPRTRAELAEAITAKEVPSEVAESILDRLGAVGLVDDAAFANAWVESRHSGRGLARRALAHELRRRGVGEQEIDNAVEQVSGDDERSAARHLVDCKLTAQPSLRRLDRTTQVRRLAGMLGRKGYSAGLAAQVIKEALVELPPTGDEPDDLGEAVAPLETTEG